MKKKIIIITFVITSLLILCNLYFYYENTKLSISNYNIVNEKIPSSFNNFKIIQISDLHNTKYKKLTDQLVKKIEYEKPNIIVLTGDLIDSNKTNIDIAIQFIKKIKNIAPIYFVSGNHESSISENCYNELKEKLTENQVIILDDKIDTLKVSNSEINLIGINDPQMTHIGYFTESEIIENELNSIEYDNSKYSILLSHRPELFNNYVEKNIDLVLSGHAHGGQIRIPFIGGVVAPNQGLFPKYTNGKFEQNKTVMIVSRGIGNSILPYRINNRPELVIITLRKN